MRKFWGLLLLTAAACTPNPAEVQAVIVRDSLGIELVESRIPDRIPSLWRVADIPSVVIGTSATEGHVLHGTSAAFRLSGGEIGIANNSTREVRIFDVDGMYLQSIGSHGPGPGEVQALGAAVLLPGDSILILDAVTNAQLRFAPDGRLLRHETFPEGRFPAFSEAVELLADGTRVVRGYEPRSVDRAVSDPQTSMSPIILVPADGSFADTLGVWNGVDLVYLPAQGPAGPLGPAQQIVRPEFQPRSIVAASAMAGAIVLGDQREAYLQVRSGTGDLIRHIRWLTSPRIASSRDREIVRSEQGFGPNRSQVLRAMDSFPNGHTVPAFRQVVVARSGEIWVERYPLPSDTIQMWWVFGIDGLWRASVESSAELRLLEVGADYVIALLRDDFGVERVELRTLQPPDSAV